MKEPVSVSMCTRLWSPVAFLLCLMSSRAGFVEAPPCRALRMGSSHCQVGSRGGLLHSRCPQPSPQTHAASGRELMDADCSGWSSGLANLSLLHGRSSHLQTTLNPRSCLLPVQMKVERPPVLQHAERGQRDKGWPSCLPPNYPCPPRPSQCMASVGTLLR